VIPRTQLVFLWNTCPLIKQVPTVSSDHTHNCCNNTASVNFHSNTTNRSVPPSVALQSLPVCQYVFRSNSKVSVINSAKHNFAYVTTEHIRYVVSNQASTVTACRDKFTFCTTQQFNCVNFCCAFCHNLCYSYIQSVATFWTTQQFNCANSCCAVCHNLCYSYSQSVATFCTTQQFKCANSCCAFVTISVTATVSL
jgi:hypothetical protein